MFTVAANLSLQIRSLVVLPLFCFPLLHPQSVGYETISNPKPTYDRRRVEDTTLMSKMFSTILEAVRLNETLHRQRDSNINGFDRLSAAGTRSSGYEAMKKKWLNKNKQIRTSISWLLCSSYSHMTRTMSPRPRGQRAWPILGERERERNLNEYAHACVYKQNKRKRDTIHRPRFNSKIAAGSERENG